MSPWLLVLAACVDADTPPLDSDPTEPMVTISGVVFQFGTRVPLADARVAMAEDLGRYDVTDDDGAWSFQIPAHGQFTARLQVEGHVMSHGETWAADQDRDRLYLQAIPEAFYEGIEPALATVRTVPDPATCQIATTVTVPEVQDLADFAAFQDYHPYGLADATASIPVASVGPVYLDVGAVPNPGLTDTTVDGGILRVNVPAGAAYEIAAAHPDHEFIVPLVTCEPGRIVNANPPHGAGARRARHLRHPVTHRVRAEAARPRHPLSRPLRGWHDAWVNVPAGDYALRAEDTVGDVVFDAPTIHCAAGRFVNVSPPRSFQGH